MTSDTSFGPDQMEEGVHAWTSPCNPDPLKPGVKLMAGCNSAGVGVTFVSLPVVNSYVSKTCSKVLYSSLNLLSVVASDDLKESSHPHEWNLQGPNLSSSHDGASQQ